MDKIKNKNKSFIKNFKQGIRKLKYLDKTQLNYFIVTGFIGAVCLFTSTTYSIFSISKYLNAAVITIGKISYTVSSSTSGFTANSTGGTISVPAGQTQVVEMTLTSNNNGKTKYSLSATVSGSSVTKVYYSHDLKNNMTSTIGTTGSAITLRTVIVNEGTTSATVTYKVNGGYLKNSLSATNITQGYYEKDIVVRAIELDSEGNGTPLTAFPSSSTHTYNKVECTEAGVTPVWNNSTWSLNFDGVNKQVACDVYFTKK